MSEPCSGCGKALSLFSGRNVMFEDSDIILCDACFREVGVSINRLKHHMSAAPLIPSHVSEAYTDAVSSLRKASGIPNKRYILSALETTYQDFRLMHSSDFESEAGRKQEELLEQQRQRREEAERKAFQEQEAERQRARVQSRERYIQSINPKYEYTTKYLFDSKTGIIDEGQLNEALAYYAARGWRLVSTSVNEVGKNSYTVGLFGNSSGTNATIDVMVLIFERLVSPASSDGSPDK